MIVEPNDRRAVAMFVRASGLAVVATSDAGGRPEAALIGIAALEDGTLIADSLVKSRKVDNITVNPHVAVVVGLGGEVSMQLEGVATIASGADRQRYGTAYNVQHPGSRALEEDFAVISIHVGWVRIYDATTHPATVAEVVWTT